MPARRTLDLTEAQREELTQHRDHDPRPWVRERCAALLKKESMGLSKRA